jgi:hypothetical protein
MSTQNARNDGLEVVYRRYTTFANGQAIVVEGVPYLYDPETDEYFLEPMTTQGLLRLVHSPARSAQRATALVHMWADAQVEQPQLAMRFVGKGYEYGLTPVSLFARAADRVRDLSTSIRNEIFKINEVDFRKLSPFTTEPRVASVTPGSLIFNLEAPQEGVMAEETEQVLVKESLEVLVETAAWVANGAPEEMPEKLQLPKLRAVALKTVERLLPNAKEHDAHVELSGEIVEDSPLTKGTIQLNSEMRSVVRDRLTSAVAQLQDGEAVKIVGSIESLGRKAKVGRVHIGSIDWEVKKLQGRYDPSDHDTVRQLSQFWAEEVLVEIQGVISRKADGTPSHIDIQYIERAPQENN